jgi:hypothetical protein
MVRNYLLAPQLVGDRFMGRNNQHDRGLVDDGFVDRE